MRLSSRTALSFFAAVVFFAVIGFVFDSVVSAHDEAGECGKECKKQLADLRSATAKYHGVEEALADGYAPLGGCVALPSGPTMGIHYVNMQKLLDGELSITEPEVLVYLPEADGSLRLVAVEYMIPQAMTTELPELFGQSFHPGPMGTWTLHAWVW